MEITTRIFDPGGRLLKGSLLAVFRAAVCGFVLFHSAAALAQTSDFGDYSSFGSASSTRITTLKIGLLTDTEASATTNATATGDDITGLADEDGVTLPASLAQGLTASITVNVTNISGSSAFLNAWIDFNRNGVLTDAGEQIASNTIVANGTSNSNRTLSFTVPVGATLGTAGVRVRLTSTSSPGSTGASGNGEVEDNIVTIVQAADFGDNSAFGSASSMILPSLKMGASIDGESSATLNATATGDDITGVDDEDGVTLPVNLAPGAPASITVNVTNTSGSSAFLNAWIDYNGNGLLTDAGEQIATNTIVANGTTNSNRVINFTVPAGATLGTAGVRVRLTSTSSPGSTGASGNGEVEDEIIQIVTPVITALMTETRMNTTVAGDQWNYYWSVRTVAVQPDGSFIKVWIDTNGLDGQAKGIFGRRFDASGAALSGEFLVNTTTAGDQDNATIAVASDGSFIVAWDGPGSGKDVFAQRFSAAGEFVGDQFLLNTNVSGGQIYPEVEFFPDNSFVATYIDGSQTVMQRFDADARRLGQEVRISAGTGSAIMDTIVVRPDNSVLLTWTDNGDVYGQLFTATLDPLGAKVMLNQYTPGMQQYSIARVDGRGNIVVVWESAGQDGSGLGGFGRRFDANLNPLGNEFAMTTNTIGDQIEPQVVVHASGRFVVAWTDLNNRDGGGATGLDRASVWMRLFDESGNPVGSEIMVNQTTTGYQGYPVLDINDSGRLVVAWEGNGTQPAQVDNFGIFARTYQLLQTGATTMSVTPTTGDAGDLVTVTMTLTAPSSISNVAPNTPSLNGTNGVYAKLVSGPTPSVATVGTTATSFTWTYRLAALNKRGLLTFGGNADDDGSNIFPYATSDAVTVTPTLYIRDVTSPNIVGDSNVQTSPGAGPEVFTIGARVTNPGTADLTDVIIYLGDGTTPGTFPSTTMTLGQTNNTYQGDFKLRLLANTSDATRPLFTLGAARNVIAGGVDFSGNGTVGPEDNGILSNGMRVIAGRVDVNDDNVINSSDNKPLPPGVFEGYLEPAIINGYVDSDRNGIINAADVDTFGGETQILYWQVVYETLDAFGKPTFGDGGDIGDDLRYDWSVWGTATGAGGTTRTAEIDDSTKVRSEQSAGSNKVVPTSGAFISGIPPRVIAGQVDINSDGSITAADNGTYYGKTFIGGRADMDGNGSITAADNGVINGFNVIAGKIDADGNGSITTADDMIMVTIGQTFTITANSAAFGTIGAGYDANRDGLFDYDLWHQPVGESDWNATAFRLIDIQSNLVGTGGSNAYNGVTLKYSNEPYLSRITTSGGFNASYTYTYLVLAPGTTLASPYQQAASGTNNEKYSGDYGVSVKTTTGTSGATAISLSNSGTPGTVAVNGTTTWGMTYQNTSSGSVGDPGTGNGIVIESAIPANTTYVAGSATCATYPCIVQYSTNAGTSWSTTPPAASGVNRLRWIIDKTVPAGGTGTVSFQTEVNSGTAISTQIPNQAIARIGVGPVIATANASVMVIAIHDYGDYSGFPLAQQVASNAIFMGTAATDVEDSNLANGTATGDNFTATNDEDIAIPVFTVGAASTLNVPMTITAASLSGGTSRVNVFVDWNGDGLVTGIGETQTVQTVTSSGTRTFSLTPPAGTTPGTKYLRIRCTEGATAPSFSGNSALKGEVEDYAVVVVSSDFGDYSNFGIASSTFIPSLKIGALTDDEAFATTNATATGDDITGLADEDGVTLPASLIQGVAASMTVNVTNTSGASAFLNAWIDFNQNGVLTDAGEQIATNTLVANGTSNSNRTVNFTVPVGAVPGSAGVRVRLTSTSSPGSIGHSGNGEVEDNVVTIVPPTDFGDHSSFASASSTVISTLKIGALTDAEASATTNASATGDDITGLADEDGVTLPASLAQGVAASITVNVTNTSGSSAFLNAWIDYNQNGVLTDAGEQIAANTLIANGTSNSNRTLSFTVPAGATLGAAGVRVRLTSTSSPGATGASGNGEVEDNVIAIVQPLDFGDATGYAAASAASAPGTPLFGALVDYEASQAADDNTIGADEDGVYVVTDALQGRFLYVNYDANTSSSCFVNIWVDWNRNGNFADAGEQVLTNQNHTSRSTGTLKIPVPLNAVPGASWVRARISSASGAGPTGITANGEVEDHPVTIVKSIPVSGVIFEDTNGNGQQDSGEPGIQGIAIYLWGSTYSYDMGITGATGGYSLLAGAGNHRVRFGFLDSLGYTLSPKDVGNDATDSDMNVLSGGSTVDSDVLTLTEASPAVVNLSCGLVPTANSSTYFSVGNRNTGAWSTTAALPTYSDPDSTLTAVRRTVSFLNTSDIYVENLDTSSATFESVSGNRSTLSVAFPTNSPITTSQQSTLGLPGPLLGANDGVYAFNPNGGLSQVTGYGLAVKTSGVDTGTSSITAYQGAAGSSFPVQLAVSYDPQWTGPTSYTVKTLEESIASVAVGYRFERPDAGDYSGFPMGSQLASGAIRIGTNATDTEAARNANASATADNLTGINDEDLVMPSFFLGSSTSLVIPVTIPVLANLSGSTSRIGVWVDWNDDGVVTGTNETLAAQTVATVGTSNVTFSLTPPAGTVPGTKYLRIRITEGTTAPAFAGASVLKGEVEDYAVVVAVNTDFGDHSSFGTASSTVISTLKIGALTDVEISAVNNATATGDDITGLADEDGVTLPASATQGAASSITVNVTNTSGSSAFLNAWIDYNQNGVLTDAGEQIASNTLVANGTSNSNRTLNFTVPAGATPGAAGVRVRLTSTSSPGSIGASGNGEVEDNIVTIVQPVDYGDHIYGSLAASTASQTLTADIRIGTNATDSELTDPSDANANADDTTGINDEDLVMPVFTVGVTTNLVIPVTIPVLANLSGNTARIGVWVDWNGDGVVTGTNETLAAQAVATAGTSNVTFSLTPPAGTLQGTKYLRIRITEGGTAPAFAGASALKGEVEDYAVVVASSDFGDYSSFGSASSTVISTLKIGALTDGEISAAINATATGDDITGLADEDGVTLPANLTPLSTASIIVNVTNTSGSSAFLNAWIDYNQNGVLTDVGEQIASNTLVANGTNNSNRTLNFTVPVGAVPGTAGVRVRLTSTGTPGPTGASGNGEVEDNIVTIVPIFDFGDHLYGSLAASSAAQVASADIKIGANPTDAEASDFSDAAANKDNITGINDEELTLPEFLVGVTTNLVIPVTIPVLANLSGSTSRIGVWVDWNGDGLVTGPNETLAAQTVATVGTSNVTFSLTPPAGTLPGTKYLRIRVTEGLTAPLFNGTSVLKGEVEDYAVIVNIPVTIGNLVWEDANNNGLKEAGESGLAGATVQLFSPGADNAIGGTGANADTQVGSNIITSVTGAYLFNELKPGNYFVKTSPPASHRRTGGTPSLLDDDIDNNNDGSQPGGPGTPAFSPIITLQPGTESITDGDTNPDTNLTVDFGFIPSIDYGDFASFTQASSAISSTIYLGDTPADDEVTAALNSTASGDDNTGIDDEDTIVQSVLRADQSGTLTVKVSNTSGAAAFLNGWVDWNQNGLLEASERIFNNISIANGASLANQTAAFTVPAFTPAGTTYARFRLTSTSTAGTSGYSGTGEVEDHPVLISPPDRDYGDFSLFANASSTGTATMKLGPVAADVEPGSTNNATATGDNITGVNDEDGLTQGALHPGASGSVTVNVTNTSGGTRFLSAWIDWNGNGILESTERIATGATHSVANGLTNTNIPVSFVVPATAAIGQVGARLRFSTTSAAPATGFDGTGEVEDHLVTITCPAISVSSPALPNAVVGQPYAQPSAFTASGMSTGSYVYTATGVPVGMAINSTSRRLENAPTTPGLYSVLVSATSSSHPSCAGTTTAPLRVCPVITISPSSLTTPYVGEVVSVQFNASAAAAPLTWSVTAGTLPNGLSFSPSGLLSGTAQDEGSYTFTLTVTDADGCSVSKPYTQAVNSLSVGNLVFLDHNENGRADAGEGIASIPVHLFESNANPLVDAPVKSTTTEASGRYLFTNLAAGEYFIFLPPNLFTTGFPLAGLEPLTGTAAGDDDVGSNTLPSSMTQTEGVRTGNFVMAKGTQPTAATGETGFDSDSDDAFDSDVDLTIDIGLRLGTGIGNLVFYDANENGVADPGEGVAGVTVELYNDTKVPGIDTPLLTTVTDADGAYLFFPLINGSYRVHIPASNFSAGKPLFENVSIAEGIAGDDDVGENGINVANPALTGVSSGLVLAVRGTAPTTETGETGFNHTSDDAIDAAIDLTVDFGFQTPVGVGNVVFIDSNKNGVYDSGEGIGGVRVELFGASQPPGSLPLFTQTTGSDGGYFFNYLPTGSYRVHIPSTQFRPGALLDGTLPLANTIPGDDDAGQDGIFTDTPFNDGVSSATVFLANNTAPTSQTTETGFNNSQDQFDDNNHDLTIDFGFTAPDATRLKLGNLVFEDLNGNSRYDDNEGVPGVIVRLFSAGITDLLSSPPLAETVTDDEGCYLFSNLVEGDYVVHIPPSQFAQGAPLHQRLSLPGAGLDSGWDDDVDENGIDAPNPEETGIQSCVVNLAIGTEPTGFDTETGKNSDTDNSIDANGDLTIDFGFFRPMSVGNLVFIDADADGVADPGEGVGGVEVQLYPAVSPPNWNAPIATTVTDNFGRYLFSGLSSGAYQVYIPPSAFAPGAPLHNLLNSAGYSTGDDNLGEDGIDEPYPESFGVASTVFILSPGQAPAGSAEAGLFGTDDDGSGDSYTDLTVDFGFSTKLGVGNLVFIDLNDDGKFNPDTESGLPYVLVEIWLASQTSHPVSSVLTNSDGSYLFEVPTGQYYIRIPASEFAPGAPLNFYRSSTSFYPSTPTTAGDDNVGEDGLDAGDPVLEGVRTPAFSLIAGGAPTGATTETGYGSTSDDSNDANYDLTVDLGFHLKPLTVGNLVFRDLNNNGVFDGTDRGISGVLVKLYRAGTNPQTTSPVAATLTDSNGIYLLEAPSSGTYFIRFDQSLFATGGRLAGAVSSSNFGTDNGTDDNDDGIDAVNPASTGINSISFELAYGTEPVSGSGTENGYLSNIDDDYDNIADLTIDFGFVGGVGSGLGAIGNLVFKDLNSNGRYDSGEGVPNVVLRLRTPGSSINLASALTDTLGRYRFPNLPSGSYVIHVAKANFHELRYRAGAFEAGPLYTLLSVPGNSIGDDNTGEDGIDAPNPVSTGISTGTVTLTLENAPLNEPGAFPEMNSEFGDANTDLTVDLGFRSASQGSPSSLRVINTLAVAPSSAAVIPDETQTAPAYNTYAQWALAHELGSLSAPDQDADRDGVANLLEYALGLNPLSGLNQAPELGLAFSPAEGLSAAYTRPVNGLEDIRYQVEVASSPDQEWQRLDLLQSVTSITADGRKGVRMTALQSHPALADSDLALVRLRINLDADGNGSPEVSAVSQSAAWMRNSFAVGKQTLSLPLLQPAVFSGAVISTTAASVTLAESGIESVLTAGTAYYLEVATGEAAGHRFEIDEAASRGSRVVLALDDALSTSTTLPASVVGARIGIRPHWTLPAVLPADSLVSGTSTADADGALYFDRASDQFIPLWLQSGTSPAWFTADGQAASSVILPPGQGLLVVARSRNLALDWTGYVRDHAFRHHLSPGTQLIGSGFPAPASPASLGLRAAQASLSPAASDRLRIWTGDALPAQTGYQTLFFLQSRTPNQPSIWVDQKDTSLKDQTQIRLLKPGRATFFQRATTAADFGESSPRQ